MNSESFCLYLLTGNDSTGFEAACLRIASSRCAHSTYIASMTFWQSPRSAGRPNGRVLACGGGPSVVWGSALRRRSRCHDYFSRSCRRATCHAVLIRHISQSNSMRPTSQVVDNCDTVHRIIGRSAPPPPEPHADRRSNSSIALGLPTELTVDRLMHSTTPRSADRRPVEVDSVHRPGRDQGLTLFEPTRLTVG